jgi:hypothetical protein
VSGIGPDTGGSVAAARCYYLPRHVYACRTDDGVVFLDAQRDRYFGLGGAAVSALPSLVRNWPSGDAGERSPRVPNAEVEQVANKLTERGLLCRGENDQGRTPRTSVPLLAMDLPPAAVEAHRALRAIDWLYFASACLRALWLLKRQPLGSIASDVTAARPRESRLDVLEVFGLVQAFRRLRRLFFSEKDRCLLNALALVFFLRSYGYFPLFVIGVKTGPFSAHSWVQHEELLLEGDPASICHFVPILVA